MALSFTVARQPEEKHAYDENTISNWALDEDKYNKTLEVLEGKGTLDTPIDSQVRWMRRVKTLGIMVLDQDRDLPKKWIGVLCQLPEGRMGNTVEVMCALARPDTESRLILLEVFNSQANQRNVSSVALYSRIRYLICGISRSDCQTYLQSSEVAQIHKAPAKRVVYMPTVPKWPHSHFMLDSEYMKNLSRNYTYFTIMIDLFTKKVWCWPKVHMTAKAALNGPREVLMREKEILEKEWGHENIKMIVHTDNGTEFKAEKFSNFVIDELGADYRHGLPYHPWCQGAVERAERTIKAKIYQNVTQEGSRQWDKFLQPSVASYNDTPHRVTGYKPDYLATVTEKDNEESMTIVELVRKHYENRAESVLRANVHKIKAYPPGTVVRVALEKAAKLQLAGGKPHTWKKVYMANWSTQLYQIESLHFRNIMPICTLVPINSPIPGKPVTPMDGGKAIQLPATQLQPIYTLPSGDLAMKTKGKTQTSQRDTAIVEKEGKEPVVEETGAPPSETHTEVTHKPIPKDQDQYKPRSAEAIMNDMPDKDRNLEDIT